MSSTVLLTFGLALVLEGAMGEIWGNNSTAIRPSYADESFTFGGLFLPKAQVYGGLIAVVVLVAAVAGPDQDVAGPGDPGRGREPRLGRAGRHQGGVRRGPGVRHRHRRGRRRQARSPGVLYPFVPGSHYQWIARLLAIVVLGGLGSLERRRASAP